MRGPFARRGARWNRSVGSTPSTPFETLQAALGADLVGMWRVPAADDGTINVSASRVQSLSSTVGGNAMAPPVLATNAPLFRTDLDGLSGGACIQNDASGRYMEAALTVATANRAMIYIVGRQVAITTSTMVWINTLGATVTNDSLLGLNYGNTGYQHKACVSTGSELIVNNAPPVYAQWHLLGIIPLASGMLARVDGATAATNFASSLAMRDIATVRAGSTGSLNGHYWKSIYVVQNGSIAYEQAIRDYELAEGVLLQPLATMVFSGQSNAARLVIGDFVELPGYTTLISAAAGQPISNWSKAGGGSGYTNLLAVLQRNVATGLRPVIVWAQGESDSDSALEAAAYLAALEQLRTDLETDLGQGSNYIYWIVCRFHDDFISNPSYLFAGTVDTSLATFAANHAGHAVTLDPNDSELPLEADDIHWGPNGGPTSALQQWMMDGARTLADAAGLLP